MMEKALRLFLVAKVGDNLLRASYHFEGVFPSDTFDQIFVDINLSGHKYFSFFLTYQLLLM
jgi:hypothetical protein